MPYSSMDSVPANLKKMDGIPLTLAQVNWIARIADGIPEGQVDNPWAVAKAKFKKSFTKKDGKWVAREGKGTDVEKDFVVVGDNLYFTLDGENWSTADEAFDGMAVISKENGRYRIETVSTAALKDREGETFGTDAMDYDIAQAEATGKYPEFRVFHKSFLGIGIVEKMRRVGIFAIDEGISYDDPFSLEVCEKMLAENDGTWKVSRGFKVLEASGLCPECGEGLVIRVKHMVAGFRCPCCKSVHLGYKRVLKDIRFRRTRTFDVTVTDVPAVPWTSAAAFPISSESKEYAMTKKELRKKLLAAGLAEDVVDERLKDVSDERLKELSDIPEAVLLKELELDKEDDTPSGDEQVFVLDPEVLKEFRTIVREEVKGLLDGLQIDIPEVEFELKELEQVSELLTIVKELKEAVDELTESDEKRLKSILEDAPRSARLRIRRYKTSKGKDGDGEDDEEDDEGKPKPPMEKKERIPLSDGTFVSSMTEAVMGTAGGD